MSDEQTSLELSEPAGEVFTLVADSVLQRGVPVPLAAVQGVEEVQRPLSAPKWWDLVAYLPAVSGEPYDWCLGRLGQVPANEVYVWPWLLSTVAVNGQARAVLGNPVKAAKWKPVRFHTRFAPVDSAEPLLTPMSSHVTHLNDGNGTATLVDREVARAWTGATRFRAGDPAWLVTGAGSTVAAVVAELSTDVQLVKVRELDYGREVWASVDTLTRRSAPPRRVDLGDDPDGDLEGYDGRPDSAVIADLVADHRDLHDDLSAIRERLTDALSDVLDLNEHDARGLADAAAQRIGELKGDYDSACRTIAAMHSAAMGGQCPPVRGVVEDVADLRAMVFGQPAEPSEEPAQDGAPGPRMGADDVTLDMEVLAPGHGDAAGMWYRARVVSIRTDHYRGPGPTIRVQWLAGPDEGKFLGGLKPHDLVDTAELDFAGGAAKVVVHGDARAALGTMLSSTLGSRPATKPQNPEPDNVEPATLTVENLSWLVGLIGTAVPRCAGRDRALRMLTSAIEFEAAADQSTATVVDALRTVAAPTIRAMDRVYAERVRQLAWYSRKHDDQFRHGQLEQAAAYYLTGEEDLWPWPTEPPAMSDSDADDVVKAAALCLAELERLERVSERRS